jgi:hypothetical protein
MACWSMDELLHAATLMGLVPSWATKEVLEDRFRCLGGIARTVLGHLPRPRPTGDIPIMEEGPTGDIIPITEEQEELDRRAPEH